MTIYFIQAGDSGDIKVGYTASESPARRMKTFQTGHFAKLRLLGTIPGEIRDEKSIHRELQRYRTNGEWFRATLELSHLIKKMITDQSPWYRIREIRASVLEEEWHNQIVVPTRNLKDKSAYDDVVELMRKQQIKEKELIIRQNIKQQMREASDAFRDGRITRKDRERSMKRLSVKLKLSFARSEAVLSKAKVSPVVVSEIMTARSRLRVNLPSFSC